tara:strand:- start:1246 stop:1470 length:225 start_codon:yes stop_codon:yes gene_type:complete
MLSPDKVEDLRSIEKCREITNEILRYGVSELEIIKLIDILSLELENTDVMRKIQSVIKNNDQVEEPQVKPKFEL